MIYWIGLAVLIMIALALLVFSDQLRPVNKEDTAEIKEIKKWKMEMSADENNHWRDLYHQSRYWISRPFRNFLKQRGKKVNALWLEWQAWKPTRALRRAKAMQGRPRPFTVDSTVGIDNGKCISRLDQWLLSRSGAYPSGHSACSRYLANLLERDYPEHSQELAELADQIGWSRIWAGLHYPTDHLAGQQLADRLIQPTNNSTS